MALPQGEGDRQGTGGPVRVSPRRGPRVLSWASRSRGRKHAGRHPTAGCRELTDRNPVFRGVYSRTVVRRGQRQRWQAVTVVGLLLALLVSLLPHHDHSGLTMTCPLLVIVLLFGTIDALSSSWRFSLSSETRSRQSPDLLSRFQRPPPALP
jgi:hypothetical protein